MTHQLWAVGSSGTVLLSDDLGESWFEAGSAGPSDSLFSVVSIMNGQRMFVLGESGAILQYDVLNERLRSAVAHISNSVGTKLGHVNTTLTLDGLSATAETIFTAHVVREKDPPGTPAIHLPIDILHPKEGSSEWGLDIDLTRLHPSSGESFLIDVCVKQGGYNHCFALPKVTAIPLFDFKAHPAITVALISMSSIGSILVLLFLCKPVWILKVYNRMYLVDLLDKTSIPGASVIKALLAGTLIPYLAVHPRTLNAWCQQYRRALLDKWQESTTVWEGSTTLQAYIPLPIEIMSGRASRVINDPSPSTANEILASPEITEIVGPGGSGKTTLLFQFGTWIAMNNLDARNAKEVRIPLTVNGWEGNVESYIREMLMDAVKEKLPSDFLKALLRSGRLVLILDGFSELSPDAQIAFKQLVAKTKPMYVIASSRHRVLDQSKRMIAIKPLSASTLLSFITALLASFPPDQCVSSDMKLQLSLGSRLADVLESSGKGAPLTPLMVKLYLMRAVEVISAGGSINDLPGTIAESYFEFVNALTRKLTSWSQPAIMKAVKVLAVLSLGQDFVPRPLSTEVVQTGIETKGISNAEKMVAELVSAGLLTERRAGLGATVSFALDPIAEFCAAYGYAEECGMDEGRWAELKNRVAAAPKAEGFASALRLISQTFGPQGLCIPNIFNR